MKKILLILCIITTSLSATEIPVFAPPAPSGTSVFAPPAPSGGGRGGTPLDLFNPPSITQASQSSEKSAAKAMIMSAIFPGAGQFYVSPTLIQAYIFPAIEITLWYILYDYEKKGDNKTKEYERFADTYYSFDRYKNVFNNNSSYPNYDPHDIVRLTGYHDTNRQQFYESIGKYNRFIYGWEDWYNESVHENDNYRVNWYFDTEENKWYDDKPFWTYSKTTNEPIGPNFSLQREKYIKMRIKAEEYYESSRNMGFVILLNHAVAAFDANRVARKYNRQYSNTSSAKASSAPITTGLKTTFINDHLVPMFNLSLKF